MSNSLIIDTTEKLSRMPVGFFFIYEKNETIVEFLRIP